MLCRCNGCPPRVSVTHRPQRRRLITSAVPTDATTAQAHHSLRHKHARAARAPARQVDRAIMQQKAGPSLLRRLRFHLRRFYRNFYFQERRP